MTPAFSLSSSIAPSASSKVLFRSQSCFAIHSCERVFSIRSSFPAVTLIVSSRNFFSLSNLIAFDRFPSLFYSLASVIKSIISLSHQSLIFFSWRSTFLSLISALSWSENFETSFTFLLLPHPMIKFIGLLLSKKGFWKILVFFLYLQ